MKKEEIIRLLGDKDFLDKLYGFAYKRCYSSYEAEDLCSDIVLRILKSIHKNPSIRNTYAFIWTIARRTYADYCKKSKSINDRTIQGGYSDEIINAQINSIDQFIESEVEAKQLSNIKREIAFLSKIYGDVMVMYYLDEMKTYEIAKILNISENNVKQRLFYARNNIRKEVENVDNKNLNIKPIKISFLGNGKPVGNDPSEKAERAISQNVVYLCKDTARSTKEISEILNIPMVFIEEELEIMCHGLNGHYGLLKKLDNGKYISNFIIVDYDDYAQVYSMYKTSAKAIVDKIKVYLDLNKERILDFPFLNKQDNIKFITWSLISRMLWGYGGELHEVLKNRYMKDVNIIEREFYTFGVASKYGQSANFGYYGCDGISAYNLCGYSSISIMNIYGLRIQKHFACGHDISNDPLLLMTIKAINGIDKNTLSNDEKETAAKAIKNGYLKVENGKLYPKIVVLDKKDANDFDNLSNDFWNEHKDIVKSSVDELYGFIQKLVPKHLMNEYHQFISQTSFGFLSDVIELCIEKQVLDVPDSPNCAEGTWMYVEK